MFGTIILDAYSKDETRDISESIEEICSPLDTNGWSSAGIYSFWDYSTKEILYIGLASDLYIRFKQHNGLLPVDSNDCKYKEITDYFKKHEKIGYTILVQSPLSQPIVQRNEKKYREFLGKPKDIPIGDYAGIEGLEYIRSAEGQLIEAYRLFNGNIPVWNKIGGDIKSRRFATMNNFTQIIQNFTLEEISSSLVSRSTIRQLACNPTYEWFESQLHGIRMMMLTGNSSYQEALSYLSSGNPYIKLTLDRIKSANYMDKKLVL